MPTIPTPHVRGVRTTDSDQEQVEDLRTIHRLHATENIRMRIKCGSEINILINIRYRI